MSFINTVLGTPLGFIIYYAYRILGSYGLAVVVFAVIVKIPLFPVMLLAHKNSIRLLRMQPRLNIIKKRYAGDKDSLNEAQYELFKKERYNPLIGLVPLFCQLLLVIGILQVMYHPLQHMLQMPADIIVQYVYGVGGFAPQLQVLEKVHGELLFLGFNLTVTPSLRNPSVELVVPLISGLVAYAFCMVQNAISPGALSQSKRTNRGLTIFTVGLSLYFAYALPVGVGLYWTVGNAGAIVVVVLLNILYPPKKLAAEALQYLQTIRPTPEQVKREKLKQAELRIREKADAMRFVSAKKRLVFYALTGGQYKYYTTIIDYLLAHSDIIIHYLTNDPDDAVLKMGVPQLATYYTGQRKTISLMLKLDTDMLVTTVPDLQNFHMKRSIVRSDTEYVYVFHAPISTSLQYKEKAFDHFNTIYCVGPHHVAEMRRREELIGLPKRNLIKAGYGLYDELLEKYKSIPPTGKDKPRILIAPSWQAENIFETCVDSLLNALVGQNYQIIARPHPQFNRLFPERMEALMTQYAAYTATGELQFEMDFSTNESIYSSDLLITDWSGIAYEFAYCTSKPCIFINTPPKISNLNYKRYGIEPMEFAIRNIVGSSIDPEDIPQKLRVTVNALLESEGERTEQIKEALNKYLYYPGRSGEAGGKYIIKRLTGG